MNSLISLLRAAVLGSVLAVCSAAMAAAPLEVAPDSWDEFRQQYAVYSRYLLASYDRAFVDDFEGAVREVDKAIALLPDEGIGFAERGKYFRMLNRSDRAIADYKKSLALFDRAIERYQPGRAGHIRKTPSRRIDPEKALQLIATLRLQRGEAHFSFEQYRQAGEDFAAACQGGSPAACSRLWDVKAAEKRGLQWVPISSRQFYDRQRVEHPAHGIVRVWVRREDAQPVRSEVGPANYVQQHLELNCSTREFRLIEATQVASAPGTVAEVATAVPSQAAVRGTAPGKLLMMLCPRVMLKQELLK